MCGFCGFVDFNNQRDANSEKYIRLMNSSIHHRGPDDEGYFHDSQHQIFFGHKRLSILDLSKSGSQPFVSQSGRMVTVFNGEIYNFNEIKNQMKGFDWKSRSDTEVLIESVEKFGFEPALKKFDGMFAFALWDKKKKKLFLARDRAGEKPLYYGIINNILFFSSELKAITKHPSFKKEINTAILEKYFATGYIPAPFSIYKNIFKLSQGSYVEIDYDALQNKNFSITEKQYWSYKSIAKSLLKQDNLFSEEDYIDKLDSLINSAIKKQMISDVPLGAFLSGGIDSSLVTAIMQKNSNTPIKTFTIGFDIKDFNEAPFAKKIADYLGTDHTEHYCSVDDTINVIPQLPSMYDEPFADSSQIPTYLLSKLARESVTVSLSGDAGDELFFGYDRYIVGLKLQKIIGLIPKKLRSVVLKIFNNTPDFLLHSLLEIIKKLMGSMISEGHNVDSFKKRITHLLEISNDKDLYISIISKWKPNDKITLDNFGEQTIFADSNYLNSEEYGFNKFMTSYDISSYLADDILVKVDRASMAVSLETRIPFLSKDIIEFSMIIPDSYKYNNKRKKLILQNLLSKYIPAELFNRPKMGFGLPINKWLKSELKDWSLDLLNEKTINEQGILNYDVIMKKYHDHQNNIRSNEYYLWPVLIFQQWMQDNKK